MERIKLKTIDILVGYGFKTAGAILVLLVGITIVNIVSTRIDKRLNKSKVDMSLHSFIKSFFSFVSKIIIVIIAATIIGIPPTTFIAVLSAAGLAIGLALKDSLSNFAGGVLILFFRPFGVGDFIDAQGFMGTVKEIQLFYTSLNTTDNRRITIPNGELANGKIINYSVEDTRRLDLTFDVSFDDDIEKVKDVLTNIVLDHPLIFKEPEPLIRVKAYGDHGMEFMVRAWCQSSDYWSINYDLHEIVKEVFEEENITIPFNQLDVNLKES
ncbi:MAG: mechanosensitive ion channel [Epulopiscium sp.]|nr:mechanosensitive ion channel [Candidatus Epulonipiscium sp.]